MAKASITVGKSGKPGHIKVRASAGAWSFGEDVSASVAINLDLETALALHADIGAAIEKEAAKLKAHEERDARRKAWREREITAGRMQFLHR